MARGGSDYDAVVICNVEFPQPCYRVYLTDLRDEDARELWRQALPPRPGTATYR